MDPSKEPQEPKKENNPKYKTRLCRHFLRTGNCLRGETCQFAHGEADLRKPASGGPAPNPHAGTGVQGYPRRPHVGPNANNLKTKLCKYFMKDGNCRYGSTCHHAHGQMELRQPGAPFPFPGFGQFNMMMNPMMGMNMMGFPMNTPYMMPPNQGMADMNNYPNPENQIVDQFMGLSLNNPPKTKDDDKNGGDKKEIGDDKDKNEQK